LIVIVLVLVDCAFVLTELIFDGKLDTYAEYCYPTPSCSEQSHKLHHWQHVTHVIHICSIIVLSLFMVEVILKVIYTREHFFTHKIEMIDGIIVLLSWILDLIMLNPGKTKEYFL
jgi:hypothetical protein